METSLEGILLIKEGFRSFDPRVWAGMVTAITVFVIEIILYKKHIIFSHVRSKIEKAKEEGNVIKSHQISKHDSLYKGDGSDHIYTAKYQYIYRGKKRHKTLLSKNIPLPSTISMYYTNKSPKPVTESDKGKNPFIMLLYIIPILASTGVMYALGYRG